MSIKALSQELGVTAITANKRLKHLFERGILLNVSAEISPPAIGLDTIIFFLEVPFKNTRAIEKALDLHPYTRYRVRCLGALNGFYATFAVPSGAIPLIVEFVEKLQELGLVRRFRYRMFVGSWAASETDFSFYSIKDDKWGYDWAKWEECLDEPPPPPRENGLRSPSPQREGPKCLQAALHQRPGEAERHRGEG